MALSVARSDQYDPRLVGSSIRTRIVLFRPNLARSMIQISETAQIHLRKLIAAQGGDALGIRMRARNPGSPAADCELEFCEESERNGDDWVIECEGFDLYVDAASAPWLDGAQVDYALTQTGGEMRIHAPKLRGRKPDADASLALRVQYVLDAEINPQLAS
ncbi:MAG: hypothetical protein C4338_04580, partial [Rhodanobacteraceae bacterium]